MRVSSTFLSKFWRYLDAISEEILLHSQILGLDNAGKTTFLEQAKGTCNPDYKAMNPAKITATVGLNIGSIDTDGLRLNFWDLGGQQELQALWDKARI